MNAHILVPGPFDLAATIESGQAFRWQRTREGFTGVAKGNLYFVSFSGSHLSVSSPSCHDPEGFARWYFDIDTDYEALCQRLRESDKSVCEAVDFAPGLRLLRQEPWEVLIAFLLSQNNNIPRIKQLVARLCWRWGNRKSIGGHSWLAMPTPEDLARATDDDLRSCGVGYRARSVREAAEKVATGTMKLEHITPLPTMEARECLLSLHGVGRKVADCILLFGFGRLDAFPIDVWIKRGLENLYFDGKEQKLRDLVDFTESHFVRDAGYAQNYLFYYTRTRGRTKPED